jgi:hypothetical protein
LISHGEQFAERIVCGIAGSAALVDTVNDQIRTCKLVEANCVLILDHAT